MSEICPFPPPHRDKRPLPSFVFVVLFFFILMVVVADGGAVLF